MGAVGFLTPMGQPLPLFLLQGAHAPEALQVQLPSGLLQSSLNTAWASLWDGPCPLLREECPHPTISVYFPRFWLLFEGFVDKGIKC